MIVFLQKKVKDKGYNDFSKDLAEDFLFAPAANYQGIGNLSRILFTGINRDFILIVKNFKVNYFRLLEESGTFEKLSGEDGIWFIL